jgi:hypothetical protein
MRSLDQPAQASAWHPMLLGVVALTDQASLTPRAPDRVEIGPLHETADREKTGPLPPRSMCRAISLRFASRGRRAPTSTAQSTRTDRGRPSGPSGIGVRNDGRAALRHLALAQLSLFTPLFTVLAAHGEGQRSKTRRCDLGMALEAEAEFSEVETNERFVETGERFGFHLHDGEPDAFLHRGVGVIDLVEDIIGAVGARIVDARAQLALQLGPAILEDLPQVPIPRVSRLFGHLCAPSRTSIVDDLRDRGLFSCGH